MLSKDEFLNLKGRFSSFQFSSIPYCKMVQKRYLIIFYNFYRLVDIG